jgi:hypothetical protein
MAQLVEHDNKYRRRWMVPRCIRRIAPWKIAQILNLMQQLASSTEWSGNQELQDQFCNALEVAGLKKKGEQYDAHSGGPRTYLTQLECLGLIFLRDGAVYFTQAGEDILDGKPPLPILQRQLLRHQYPSAYGHKMKVRVHPQLRVKPFMLILECLRRPDVGYLSMDELGVLLLYGHNRECLPRCVEKIATMRAGVRLEDVIDDAKLDLYTPRGKGSLAVLRDDANTFKNYLQACCLAYVEPIAGREVMRFDEENRVLFEAYLQQADSFLPHDSYESFQRQYGARSLRGDTRRINKEQQPRTNPETSMIVSLFLAECGVNMITDIPKEFEEKLVMNFGFPRQAIRKAVEPYLGRSLDYFEATYIELSRSGRSEDAVRFEQATCALFRDGFQFQVVHTGQRRRKGIGGYADALLIDSAAKHCALVDAKASPRYALPHADIAKMVQTYLPNYRELCEDKNLVLEFATYVAGGFAGNVARGLKAISSESKVPCSAITARRLIELAKKKVSQDECRKRLRSVAVYE